MALGELVIERLKFSPKLTRSMFLISYWKTFSKLGQFKTFQKTIKGEVIKMKFLIFVFEPLMEIRKLAIKPTSKIEIIEFI